MNTKKIYLIESKIKIEADSGLEAISILHNKIKPKYGSSDMEVIKTICIYEPLTVSEDVRIINEIKNQSTTSFTDNFTGNSRCFLPEGTKITIEPPKKSGMSTYYK